MDRARPAMALATGLVRKRGPRQELEAFYRANPLQIVVGYGPGGGFDAYARVLGRHMGKRLPGSPNVVVQNMPGAASMKAANYIYTIAPKDGSQIATSRAACRCSRCSTTRACCTTR